MATPSTDVETRRRAVWRSPISWLALGLIGGQLAAGTHVAVPLPLQVALALAGTGAFARRRTRPAGLLLLAAVVGFHQVESGLRRPGGIEQVARLAPAVVHLRARMEEAPVRLERKSRVRLEVLAVERGGRWRSVHGGVLLSVAVMRRRWRRGAVFEARLSLRRPRNFGNPREFDYESYLARRGVFVTAFAYGDDRFRLCGQSPSAFAWLDDYRARVAVAFARHLRSPTREILAALVLGDDEQLPREVRRRFAEAGVSHVLSISGLHIGLVAAVAFALARWLLSRSRWLLLRARVPKLAAASCLGPVLFYAAVARGGVATGRALIMLAAMVIAVLVDRERDVVVAIAAAALAICVLWPGSVLDVSFQLSFVSVLALVLGVEGYWRWWRRLEQERLLHLRGRRWRWVRGAGAYFAVSFCALLGTAPLTAYHFNRISPIGLVANPVVVPLLGTAAVGLGLVGAVAVPLCAPLAAGAIVLAGAAIDWGTRLAVFFSSLPGASLRVVTPTPVELLLVYPLLLAAFCWRGRRRCVAIAVLAVALAADLGLAVRQRYFGDSLRLTFLSVGQGDCAVLRFPGADVMVVDGGGLAGFDVGERVVGPYLWSERIGRLDQVVLTHPQADHYGGLAFLAEEFRPREFWDNGESAAAEGYRRLRRAVGASGAAQLRVAAGYRRHLGGCTIEALNPPAAAPPAADPNDHSVVLRVACGAARLLLTGDLEEEGERRLLALGGDLRSDVLKVGHHGSRTSSSVAFLDAVRPRAAVISAGFGNRFGFPHAVVLEALTADGARVYRTDTDGAVQVEMRFDGRMRVRTARRGWQDVPRPSLYAAGAARSPHAR